ncbi:hypothetical protein Trydic_g22530 [Trypoxylus dichotomus]
MFIRLSRLALHTFYLLLFNKLFLPLVTNKILQQLDNFNSLEGVGRHPIQFDDQLISELSVKRQPTSTTHPLPIGCLRGDASCRWSPYEYTRMNAASTHSHTCTHATSTTCCCWPRSAVIRTLTPSLHQHICPPFRPPIVDDEAVPRIPNCT